MRLLNPRAITGVMGGYVTGRDSVLVPGPGHSKADRSLSIKIDHTDPQGFRVHSFAGDDWQICRDYVCAALGLVRSTGGACQPQGLAPAAPSELALQIWAESIIARGTIVETHYLKSRQLALPDYADNMLRFNHSCPFGQGLRYPCMIGLYRDIKTNQPKAIHRTALTSDGKKIDRKALGPKAGCAIKLTPDEEVSQGLTIAEGIQTGLAGMALNFRPTWVLGDAVAIAKFPVLAGIECLSILVDNDRSGTGQASALECSRRWTAMGREVFRVVPTMVGADMADVICGRAA
jgi:putative DNA primase/helicase